MACEARDMTEGLGRGVGVAPGVRGAGWLAIVVDVVRWAGLAGVRGLVPSLDPPPLRSATCLLGC